ncbi:hypothetical protein DFJ74DRAFT_416380 [Hyaloraphidium curvatum]|nr:hypothetical protein DFJ74DRAFT_416380 [Hyaloraphidium curvatum]
MIFYLKSVWRGAKGAMCVSSTTVLSRMSSDVAASDVGPSGSLMRQRRANGETDADADADVEKLVPVAIANKDQKTLVLTGASRGIGHSTVKTFAMHGYRVITVSRHPFDSNCPWPGGARNHFQWDLGQLDDADEKIAQLRQLIGTGRVEALVCNAGISPKGPGGSRLGALATDLETWHRVLNVNLVSTALLVRGLRDELIAAKGSIVMVTSIAGSRVHPFAGVAYASSKAALAALTREIAKEMAPHAVRCNAISPGEIETSILSPGTDELVAHEVPMRRLGQPSEVAETVLWLCSEKSSYVTGAEIHVNGGQHV